MQCDICGQKEQQYTAIIEGSTLNVCQYCAKFGKVLKKIELGKEKSRHDIQKSSAINKEEIIESAVPNFSILIREKRESMKQDQKDFASKLGIKTSILHKIETGQHLPEIQAIKKMEKILNLKLIETDKDKEELKINKNVQGMTIGDFIKINRE